MSYSVVIEKRATQDIQKATDYYDEQNTKIGTNFLNEVTRLFKVLEKKPYYQIRYNTIRCLPLKKFPFLIHFSIQDNFVFIHAVIHTSINPDKWPKKASN